MSMAFVLSPKPRPSEIPAHRAMTFFNAPPSSTPHHIGVDINTKPVGHKGILHQLSRRLVSAGGHTACGNPPGHLLSMAGPDRTATVWPVTSPAT